MTSMLIKLHGVAISTRLGVFAWEQQKAREFSLDLALQCKVGDDIRQDDLAATLDYVQVEHFVREFAGRQSWQLIERLIDSLAEALLAEFPLIENAKLTLFKPQALEHTQNVSVMLQKSR